MNSFIMKLKEQPNRKEYVKKHINDFETLTNEEIKKLFEEEKIDFETKKMLLEVGNNRINKLPFDLFLEVLFYIEDPDLFIKNYQNRINSLSYEELIILFYESNIDNDCLMNITEMPVFKRYLAYEQQTKIGTKIQSIPFLKELYFSNNDSEKLILIGEKIKEFLSTHEIDEEGLKTLINQYLCRWLSKEEPFETKMMSLGIFMIGHALKNHVLLSDTMLEFYIHARIKELGLETKCKNVLISQQESSVFGYYQESTETLTIYSEYLKTKFSSFFKECKIEDEKEISDFLNLNMICMISHELGHIFSSKGIENFTNNLENGYEKIGQNTAFYYWYKNGILQHFLKTQKYQQFHDQFIEENRADLFMIFDSERTLQTHFKDCFSKSKIQKLCNIHASKILAFYTEKREGKWYIKTPIEKFDSFYDSFNIREESLPEFHKKQVEDKPDSIMKNLLLGDQVPKYLLEEIQKIAKGQILTENIYTNIKEVLDRKIDVPLEETRKKNL